MRHAWETNFKGSDSSDPTVYFLYCDMQLRRIACPRTSHPFAFLHELKHKSKLSPNSLKMAAVNNKTAGKNH